MKCATIIFAVVVASASASVVKLASFDGADATTFDWKEMNDPVMGGQSTGTFVVDKENRFGVFNGTCAIVPALKAPGFCKATSEMATFQNVSTFLEAGSFQLRARSSTPGFMGFRVAFSAKNIPRTSTYGGGSFKTGFNMTGTDWQVVTIPWTEFSYDWSGFTGRCDTLDPTGQQHHCCTQDESKYCPTVDYLGHITGLELWAEGAEGDFHLDIDWIGAGDA